MIRINIYKQRFCKTCDFLKYIFNQLLFQFCFEYSCLRRGKGVIVVAVVTAAVVMVVVAVPVVVADAVRVVSLCLQCLGPSRKVDIPLTFLFIFII